MYTHTYLGSALLLLCKLVHTHSQCTNGLFDTLQLSTLSYYPLPWNENECETIAFTLELYTYRYLPILLEKLL